MGINQEEMGKERVVGSTCAVSRSFWWSQQEVMTVGEREGKVWPQGGSEAARSDIITQDQTLRQGQDFTCTEGALPSVLETPFSSEPPKATP